MKLNKTFGRVATTLVAAAMLASLAAPVYAVEPTQSNMQGGVVNNANNDALTSIVFQKDLVKPADVATPNVTFTFGLTGAEVTEGETATDNTTTVAVVSGKDHGSISDAKATFDKDSVKTAADEDKGTVTVTEYVTLNLTAEAGFTFSAPGVYKYTLTEQNVTDTNYTTSGPYTVYLYVERIEEEGKDDQFVITGATMFTVTGESETATKTKTNVMTNSYLVSGGEVVPNSLTVSKTVAGDMGDKNKPFEFEITITAKDNAKNRNYSATGATVKNNQDGTYTVTGSLKHGESLTINGLIADDRYKVNEKAYNQDGYTSSTRPNGVEDVTDFENNKTEVTFNAATADSISYTNTRTAVSPTGLAMDIAPYALLVVVAAAGCFVFLRKRSED